MRRFVHLVQQSDADRCLHEGAVLVDARSVRQRGLRFLSGASRVPWTATRTGGARSGLLAPATGIARVFAAAGVDWARPVLVVCAGPAGWGEGARVAWTLAWMGHPAVHWYPSLGRLPDPVPGPVALSPVGWPGKLCPHLRAPAGVEIPDGTVVVDVREPSEQQGRRTYGEARSGHIPGAKFLRLRDLWSPEGLAPVETVRLLAVQAGIPLDGDLVCVCTGGVRSAAAAVLLQRAGVGRSIRNHDGGMWAWAADPDRPMVVRAPA